MALNRTSVEGLIGHVRGNFCDPNSLDYVTIDYVED